MMDVSLQTYTIPKELKTWILDELWKPCRPVPDLLMLMAQKPDLSTYLAEYYSHHCKWFSREGGVHISIKTHSDVVRVAKTILEDLTWAMVSASLGDTRHETSRAVHTTINLCARLVTMCDFGGPEFGFSARSNLPWASHQTLRQAMAEYFQREKKLQPDNPRLRRLFTARHLACIGGIKIRWTDNIVDHLMLSDYDRAVFVFHNADFLRYQSW